MVSVARRSDIQGRLPMPLLDRYAWQFSGACREADAEVFFIESERGPTRRRHEAQAKAYCETCPVLMECMEHAVEVDEPYGIWGGLTVQERRQLRAEAS